MMSEPFGVAGKSIFSHLERFFGNGSSHKGARNTALNEKHPLAKRADRRQAGHARRASNGNAARRSDDQRSAGAMDARITKRFSHDLRANSGRVSWGDRNSWFHSG